MPIISGPVETLLVSFAAIVSLVLWLRQDRVYPGPRLESDDHGIDTEQLEQAEREVRDLRSHQIPDEPIEGNGWGSGAPSPPERL